MAKDSRVRQIVQSALCLANATNIQHEVSVQAGSRHAKVLVEERRRNMSQPNVLFVITDQQRADHAGFMGNRVVRTPNLDRIATSGTVFENAWVSNPVCMPNRSSIMTSRMPTAHGVIFNDRSLDWGSNTFVRQFRGENYRTGLIGKSHLQHGSSRNSMNPYRGSGAVKPTHPEGWDEIENFERFLEEAPEDPDDYYGFDHIELAMDHGARVSGHHLRWALDKGARREDLTSDYRSDAPGSRRSSEWWQIYRPPYAAEFHSTSFVAERTVAFIDQAQAENSPWLAWCSFPDPHHPMTPPGDWFDRHVPSDMELPATLLDTGADCLEHLGRFRNIHPRDQRNWVSPCGYGSNVLVQEAIAATYGMVEMIDHAIGSILDHLDATDQRENTIIVFTSDHGDMMGDHGLMLKGFMHYRGTLQVPLVISVPGQKPNRTTRLASSIDLGPTLLDLCGVQGYDGIQGYSLKPVIQDPDTSVRESVLIEDDIAPVVASLTPIPAKTRTLVTNTHRYTRNSKREEQLIDLVADPDERENLVETDAVARAVVIERLTDALIAADDAARGAPVDAGYA